MPKVSEMLKVRRDEIRGDVNDFDPDKLDLYVDKFRAALTADVEEENRADLVYEVHREVCSDYALYIAVADILGPTMKRAIKTYIGMVRNRGNPSYPDADWLSSC